MTLDSGQVSFISNFDEFEKGFQNSVFIRQYFGSRKIQPIFFSKYLLSKDWAFCPFTSTEKNKKFHKNFLNLQKFLLVFEENLNNSDFNSKYQGTWFIGKEWDEMECLKLRDHSIYTFVTEKEILYIEYSKDGWGLGYDDINYDSNENFISFNTYKDPLFNHG